MDQVIDLISSGLDSLLEAETTVVVGNNVRYLYQAKSSFIEAQRILQNSMESGDGPIGIPDEHVVNQVEEYLRLVDEEILWWKIVFGLLLVAIFGFVFGFFAFGLPACFYFMALYKSSMEIFQPI